MRWLGDSVRKVTNICGWHVPGWWQLETLQVPSQRSKNIGCSRGLQSNLGPWGWRCLSFSHFDFDQKIIEMQIPSWKVFGSLEWYPRVNIQTDVEPPGFPKGIIPKWWFFHIWPCHTISLGKRMPAETDESWYYGKPNAKNLRFWMVRSTPFMAFLGICSYWVYRAIVWCV